ncbi:TolC family protein [Pseudoleptotrichia goodfellowii]|jgi:putative outer membrane efflux protein|uniref:Putative D-tyrosyl-tRNA(Tyr) deacylase n=2 Tax=Pseudoleptotrichia goodfellowii TaxID=157692 RepID=D0GNM3_9FUSO|nr:TolC family protein [Pseudoleptotrichia goodfellowii]EEY34318.1 putative D-tyrosyl-tRNA(Tyr) deacylase [Pseudoleptotrichia goodfellowii F0264]BBM35518.1 putative D-tyrosyl-tRNA(Tyr) deacylase [Pseudoleptotrichia goodfellowii]
MRIKQIGVAVTMMLFALPVFVFGQKITVQEAAEMAIKNNKDIKIGMLEVEKGKLDVNKAWKSAYFKVTYNATANKYFKDVKSPFTGKYNQAYGQNVTLAQPIYTGGAIKSGIEIGKNYLSLMELSLDKIRKDTMLSVIQAYIDVYEAENTLEVLKKSKEALSRNYEEQKEKYKLRLVTKPEFIEAERSLKAIEADVIQQTSNIEIAKEALGNMIGVKDSEKIEIVPFTVEEKFSKAVNLKDDLAKLTTRNTEYQMALKQKEISRKNIDLEKADLRPKVTGVVTYGTSDRTKFSEVSKTKNYNGTIGLNLSWQIFDWGENKLDVEKAKRNHEIKEIEAEKALDDLKVGMKKVYYQLQALEKSLEAKKIAVEKAEEVYELEQERYSYRLITMRDLLNAESNLRQSRTDYISSKLRYYYLVSRYGAFLD